MNMRRLSGWLALVSAAMGVAMLVLWVRSMGGGAWDQISFRVGGDRYTLRSNGGRVQFAAPPGGGRDTDAKAREWVRTLSKKDVAWRVIYREEPLRVDFTTVECLRENELPSVFARFDKRSLTRALLEVLEDPRRFEVAHLFLRSVTLSSTRPWPYSRRQSGDRVELNDWGMRVEIKVPFDQGKPLSQWEHDPSRHVQLQGEPWVRCDPAQIPQLVRQWHDHFDVVAFSIPHWPIAAALLVPGALWLRRRIVQWRRPRQGLCPTCGYDLRATPGRCPECGQTPGETPVQSSGT